MITTVILSSAYLNGSFFITRRWIRLLFGREFRFSDVLLLWDALFADGASLVLVDYVFVAMLTSIREKRKSSFIAQSSFIGISY